MTETDGPIGGSEGYSRIVTADDADVVCESKSELNDALLNASTGDVVFVADDAAIDDMGKSEFTVPKGVTLASDRGHDGSKGALLKTEKHPWAMLEAGDNVRITGFRVAGPRWNWVDETETTELGIDAQGSTGVEVDNCSLSGWGYAGVRTGDDTRVRYCDIHHCSRMGHGYGVATEGSEYPIIEYNRIWHVRHAVQGNGGGYEIRYNVVDAPAISHVFDQHRPGGTRMKIHHNTVRVVENAGGRSGGGRVPAVAIRGTPSEKAEIYLNWFYNDKQPRATPNGWTDEAVIQVHVDEWDCVEVRDNHYGEAEPDGEYGARDPTAASDPEEDQSDSGVSGGSGDGEQETHKLDLSFATTCEYGFVAEDEVSISPASSTVEEDDGTWYVYGRAQHGWSATYMFMGELRRLHVPDDTEVLLDGEPYEP
ncbi:right-handed parallel beta-helix repeat-containing protein [Halopelagius fulvigenes]|uniref:Right-handed parallel beta-helix repeat-containing protein n=1 Tax=Halopelagius fulvigenes TaxID=1198324 RepID=A0ABD5TYG3_9EURY